MSDLEIARQRLKSRELGLVVVSGSEILYETKLGGFAGFLQAIDRLKEQLSGASVADTIIGKAAAFLCVYSNVSAAFAATMSRSGLTTLQSNNVRCEFEQLVPAILNSGKTGMCPFEKLVCDINDFNEAYKAIREFAARRSSK